MPIGTPPPVATALLAAKVAALSLSGRSDFVVESDRIVAITVRHSAENGLGKVPTETGFYDVIHVSASGDLIQGFLGDDALDGNGGADTIEGGEGDELLNCASARLRVQPHATRRFGAVLAGHGQLALAAA